MELDDEGIDAGPIATVRYVMDEDYLREFHVEMVATRLPRWRLHRRAAIGAAIFGAALLAWASSTGRVDVLLLGGMVFAGAGAMGLRLRRKRDRWLAYQRKLPTFGAQISVALDRGRLVQTSDRTPDVLSIPNGEIHESPRGWFVTYDVVHLGTEVTDDSVSTERSSAYLPHRNFEPALSRDALAAELAHTFKVRRL